MEHKHNVDHVKHHYGKDHDHMHEQEKVKQHSAGHKMHHEHVKRMCKGGYAEGGDVEFESKTGQNKNIGDDVRARAMAAMGADNSMDREPNPTPKAKPRAKAKSKSNAMTDAMSRMNIAGDTYKKGGMAKGKRK